MRPVSATDKTAVMEFEITEELLNGKGTLHGGQTALLVDITTALAITLTVKDVPLVSIEIGCRWTLLQDFNCLILVISSPQCSERLLELRLNV